MALVHNGPLFDHVKERWSHWTHTPEKILFNRLLNLVKLYEDESIQYPATFIVLGFNKLHLKSKEELKDRILELCDILFLKSESIFS